MRRKRSKQTRRTRKNIRKRNRSNKFDGKAGSGAVSMIDYFFSTNNDGSNIINKLFTDAILNLKLNTIVGSKINENIINNFKKVPNIITAIGKIDTSFITIPNHIKALGVISSIVNSNKNVITEDEFLSLLKLFDSIYIHSFLEILGVNIPKLSDTIERIINKYGFTYIKDKEADNLYTMIGNVKKGLGVVDLYSKKYTNFRGIKLEDNALFSIALKDDTHLLFNCLKLYCNGESFECFKELDRIIKFIIEHFEQETLIQIANDIEKELNSCFLTFKNTNLYYALRNKSFFKRSPDVVKLDKNTGGLFSFF